MPLCAQLGNTDIYYQTKCRYGLKRAQDVNAANLETFPNIHINGSTGKKPVQIVNFNAVRVSFSSSTASTENLCVAFPRLFNVKSINLNSKAQAVSIIKYFLTNYL